MSRSRTPRPLLGVVAVAAVTGLVGLASGCGGGSDGHGPRESSVHPASKVVPLGRSEKGASNGQKVDSRDHGDHGCESMATCYSAHRVEAAYGVLPLLGRGIDGRGETVVLPELAEPQFPAPASDIREDLAKFDQVSHLPKVDLRVVDKLAPSASPWMANGEEVLDTEMVHTIAPGAAIVEVLVKGTSLKNTSNAVAASVSSLRLGASLGDVISISAAGQVGGENCSSSAQVASLHAALAKAVDRHVTVVAASGDIGAVGEPCQVYKGLVGGTFPPAKEVNLPAADPLVLGVGGTALTARRSGAYVRETVWGLPFGEPGSHFQASGGGISGRIGRPGYQKGIRVLGAGRGVPDVAATASPHTALGVITVSAGGGLSVHGSGGTSSAAPVWAGTVALADQHAGRSLGLVNTRLYRIARGPRYHRAFHDVTRGDNSVRFSPKLIRGHRATRGWDPATGLGSPDAAVLVPLLGHR